MATQYSNKPIVTDGLVYALDFGNPKSYVSGSATAQSLIYKPTPARFETLLPGDYGIPAAAYSVRKVVSSYTGSAMMVQSASVSQSIGFDANGNLDTGSLLTFAGSGNAFVKIWYDQSGNGRNAIQTTVINQPQIVNGGNIPLENNKITLNFNSSKTLLVPGLENLPTASFSFYITCKTPSSPGINAALGWEGLDDTVLYPYITDQTTGGRLYWRNLGLIQESPSVNIGDLQVLYSLNYSRINGINTRVFSRNSNIIRTDTSTNTSNGFVSLNIGSGLPSDQYLNTNIQEVILYSSNQSSNRITIETNINNYFNIYPPSTDPTPDFDSGVLNFTSPDSLVTNQTFPGFSYDRGNSTVMYVGETKGNSSVFTQDTNMSVVSTTSSVGFGSISNNLGRTYPVNGLKHVTLRFSSGSVDCFVNGVPVPANSIFPTGSSVAGGKFAIPVYTGSLGLVQVYNRPLTGDEIWNNYQLTAPRYGLGALQNKPYTLDDNAYLFLSQSGITDPIITGSIDTFVRGLKANNLWDKMIAIYPFVGTGSDETNLTGSHRWNLKEPSLVTYPLSFTGSWIGSTSGSAPSGSNTNISVNGITPSQYYPFFNTQSAHISILSYDTPVSSSYLMGTGMTEDLAVSTLAGDYGTPAAAYSVRKVRTAYSGALMDVRRSLDNVTSSIGYVSNGDLDTGSLLNFVKAQGENSPGNFSGLAAAYSLRKVSSSYDGYAVRVRGEIENQVRDIGFDASGNLDTGSLLNFTATGSNTLPGSYSGLAAAYALRKVVSGYAGDAIEVQSGSVSQSIGFDSLGNLDTGSLLTFAGSGNAFVKTWYDQSGNGYHASQLINSRQPQIAGNGVIITENSKPALSFDGADDFLTASFAYNINTLGVQKVERWRNLNNGQVSTTFTQEYGPYLQWIQNNQTFENYYNSGQAQTDSPATTTRKLYSFYTSLGFYENGTLTVSKPSVRSSVGNTVVIGAFGESNLPASVNTQELLIYTSSQASNRTYIENNINAYYDIYTTASTSTENAFVNTWYDQSGNGRHATQTATGSQPLIVSSGSLITENGKPAIRFTTNHVLPTPLAGNTALPFNVFAAVRVETVGSIGTWYLGFTGGDLAKYMVHQRSIANGGIQAGFVTGSNVGVGEVKSNTANTSSMYLHSVLYNTPTMSMFIDNTLIGTSSLTDGNYYATQNITIGSGRAAFRGNFKYSELLIYTSNQAADRPLIENNINNYYNIYTGSNHGFVSRWYDQSGNNRHAVQTTQARQPIIVESGSLITELTGSKPTMYFESGNPGKYLDFSAFNWNQGLIFDLSRQTAASSVFSGLFASAPASGQGMFFVDASGLGDRSLVVTNNGTPVVGYAGGTTLNRSVLAAWNKSSGSTPNLFYNGISQSLGGTRTDLGVTGGNINFGFNNRSAGKYQQELIIYTTASSVNREPIQYNINSYFNVFTQSVDFATSSFTIQAGPTSVSASLNNRLTSGIAASGPLGLITVSRTGSNSLTIARNGVTSSYAVPASGALSTGIYLGAINNNGLALGNSPLNISFASVGTGLTGAETFTYNGLVQKFQTDLRRAYLLDFYVGAVAAYSLRRLSINYTGSAIEVRRSNDNALTVIGFTPVGDLDIETLQTFVGSNTGFVRTWYDQSGNNKHTVQTSTSNQPRIVNNGTLYTVNNKPRIEFASNLGLIYDAPIASLTEVSTYTAYHMPVFNRDTVVWSTDYNSNFWHSSGTGYIGIFSTPRRGGFATSTPQIGPVLYTSFHTGSAMTVFINGNSRGTNNGSSFTSGSWLSLGPLRSGINHFDGGIYEVLIFPTSNSGSRGSIESNIVNYYNLY